MANILGNVYARLKTGVSNFLGGDDDDDDKIKLQTKPVQSVSFNTRQSGGQSPRVRVGKSFSGNNNVFTNFKDNYKNFQNKQAIKVRENRQKQRDFISGILNKPKEILDSSRVSLRNAYQKDLNPRVAGSQSIKNVVKSVKDDPGQLWIGRGFAEAPAHGQIIGRAIAGDKGGRIGTDIGYALQGAGQVTPFNSRLAGEKTRQIEQALSGLTPEGETVKDVGRSTYLTALTWPALQAAGLLDVLPTFRVAGSVGLKEGALPAIKYLATSPQIGANLLKYFGGQTALNLANHTLGEKYMGKNPAEFAGDVLMDSIASSLMLAGAESTIGAFGASKLLDNVKFIKNLKTNINQSVLQTLDKQMMPMWQNKFINSMVTDNQGNLLVNNPSFKAWQQGVEQVFKSELPKGNITGLINFMKNVPAAPPSYVTQLGSGVPSAQAVQAAMAQSPVTAMAQQFIAQSSQAAPSLVAPAAQAAAPTITQGVQAAAPAINQAAAQAVQGAGEIVTPESLRNANKAFNMENSKRMVQQTLEGAREHLRLDKPENIQKLVNVLGVENPTPDSTVTVLRAGTGAIEDGNFVTTRPELAQKYQSERPGSEIIQEEVPLRDLVQTDGLRGEFIFSPQKPENLIQSSMANFSAQQQQAANEAILADVRNIETTLNSMPTDPATGDLVMNNQSQAMLSQVGYALEDNPALITELDGRTVKALEDAGIQIQGTDGQFKDAGQALQEYRFQKQQQPQITNTEGQTTEQALTPDVGQQVVDRGVTETGQTAQVGDQQVPVGASGATADDLAQATGQPQDIVGATEVPVSAAEQVEAPITQNKYEEAMNDIATLLLPSGERPALTARTTQVRTRAQALKALRNLAPTEKVEVFNQLRSRLTPIEMAPPGTPFTVQTGQQAREILKKYPGANIQVMNELPPGTEPINSLTQAQIDVMLSENPVGKIEEIVYGSATPEQVEFEQGIKSGAGFFGDKTRALQENASRIVGEWTESPSPVMRNFARLLQGVSGGLGKTAEDVARKGQYAGGIDYASQLAGDTQSYIYDLVGSDTKTLEKLHSVLDPELAKKSVNFDDLTPQEQEAVGVLRTISDFINDTNYKNGFLSEEQWLSNRGGKYIARAYEDYDYPEELDNVIKQGRGKLDLNPFKKRENLTDWKEENAIRDPAYLMAKRLQQTMFNDTVKKMSEELLNTGYVSDVDKPGYVQVSDHKAYGDLAGKFIRKDVMEDIKGFFFTHDAAQKAYDLLNWYDRNPVRGASKKLLTIFNPAVQLGNKTGNYVFAWLNGINPVTFTKNKSWANKAVNDSDPLVRRMTKDGLLGTDITKADITRMAQELKQGVEDPNILKKIDESVTKHYGKVDDVAKVAAMKTWLDRGYTYEEAARRVYNGFQNYRTVGWLYDVAAKSPVLGNPFVRFKADLGRILKNAAVDHPFRLGMTLAGWMLFTKAASVLSNESSEDKKTREGRLGASRIPFTDISLEFQTPWGAVNAGRLIGPQTFNQLNGNSALGDLGDFGPFLIPQVSTQTGMPYNITGDPILQPIVSLLTDTDFRGKSISDPDQNKYTGSLATSAEKALNRMKYLGESYSPPGLDDINRVLNSFMGKKDYYGRTFTPGQSIARLFGLKVEEFGPEQAQEQREKNAYYSLGKIDGLQKKISSVYSALGKGEIDGPTAEKRAAAFQKQIDKIFNDMGQQSVSAQGGEVGDISALSKTDKKKIQSFLDAGIDVSDQDLLNYYIGDVAGMPSETTKEALKKQEAAFKIVDDVLESDLPDEKKALVLNNVGINEEDARYYMDATESQKVRYGQVVDMIQGTESPEELFDRLVALKREVNGRAILTSTVITDLYENGYISSTMKKLLGKYRYNPSTGEVELSRSASESGSKPKKLSISGADFNTPSLKLNTAPSITLPKALVQTTPSVSLRVPDSIRPESFSSSRVSAPTAGSKISPRIRQGARTLSQLGSV